MIIPGDSGPNVLEATPLFNLTQIKTDQVGFLSLLWQENPPVT